jgi:uncharacterized protein with GYD domain
MNLGCLRLKRPEARPCQCHEKAALDSKPFQVVLFDDQMPGMLQNIKQSPSRLDAARKAFEAAGAKMKDFYMVTGQHDMIAVVDAPDDVALAKAVVGLVSRGASRRRPARAFTEDECRKIIGGLS